MKTNPTVAFDRRTIARLEFLNLVIYLQKEIDAGMEFIFEEAEGRLPEYLGNSIVQIDRSLADLERRTRRRLPLAAREAFKSHWVGESLKLLYPLPTTGNNPNEDENTRTAA
jgi:hypothetical protein